MNKLPCCWGSHGEETRKILLGCLQMLGFCTSQALACTSSPQVSSAAPPWWRAQCLGQTPLLSTKTSKQGCALDLLLPFFPTQEQTGTTSTTVFSPPFLSKSQLFISKRFCWLQLGTYTYSFLHRQISIGWVVLADNSKDMKKMYLKTSYFTFCVSIYFFFPPNFSTNAFSSTAYSQVSNTDQVQKHSHTPPTIKIFFMWFFSTVNLRRKKNNKSIP